MEKQALKGELEIGKKIKQIREDFGVTLDELSKKTGISSAILSQIENHLVSPSLGTIIKIAKALEIKLGTFFDQNSQEPFIIVRKGERKPVSRFASKEGVKYGYYYESLGFDMKDRHMEPFLVTLEPATFSKAQELSSHDGEEFIFVLEGNMEVQLGENKDILHTGDSIYYNSMIPHRVQCHKGKEAKILAVIYTSE